MSSPTAVVVPTADGKPVPGGAASATPMKGGMMLSPLPLGGGKRRSKKLSKKVLKMMKKMTPKQLKKLMKGGEDEGAGAAGEGAPAPGPVGARRRGRKTARKSRRSGLLY
jgi:hypothetical protein